MKLTFNHLPHLLLRTRVKKISRTDTKSRGFDPPTPRNSLCSNGNVTPLIYTVFNRWILTMQTLSEISNSDRWHESKLTLHYIHQIFSLQLLQCQLKLTLIFHLNSVYLRMTQQHLTERPIRRVPQ